MNYKKFLMIALLIIFIAAIGFAFIKINNKSEEIAGTKQEVESKTEEIIEITDNFFIEQTNDIYLNLDDYVGKTVKLEGLIYSYSDETNPQDDTVYYAVVRNTPGCCGNDGLAGLDIRYDGQYPKKDTWVEAVGVVKKDKFLGSDIPALEVISLKEKETGTTFVTN